MVDKIEKWWKAPPEFEHLVEQNRANFKAQFGSFPDALIKRYWLGTSDDGAYLAFQFYRPDGTIQRFTMCREWVSDFVIQLAGATDDMNERALAAGLAAVPAKGQA
ncbi:hypothetical protein GCM10007881_16020 [Mesorhizobium huakuii]|uniref:hypothetical protein n=1 Tax=Mesorhizobium huakuii TaxID=28104 RepID=UPI00235CF854|nr:hypothetical protein [Mesorhizobium huakuii]GLQ78086.1 hypothetical protein GCM10007881_16020 [Mesorhizobium huakuii]